MAHLEVDDLLAELGDLTPTPTRITPAAAMHALAPAVPSSRCCIQQPTPPSQPSTSRSPHAAMPTRKSTSKVLLHAASDENVNTLLGGRGKTDLDQLLNDFGDLGPGSPMRCRPAHARSTSGGTATTSTRTSLGAAKCMGLFIGGSSLPRGRNGSTVGALMCCDNLRCTKCDFKVRMRIHAAWCMQGKTVSCAAAAVAHRPLYQHTYLSAPLPH